MDQDAVIEGADTRRGIDTQLVAEADPKLIEGAQGIGVPAGAIERHHEQLARSLAQRIVLDGCAQQADNFARHDRPMSSAAARSSTASRCVSFSRRTWGWANSS